MDIQTVVPPILWRRLRPAKPMKEYNSYDSALADSDTYEDPAVIEVVSSRTKAYREETLADKLKTVNNRQTVQNMFVLSHVCDNKALDVLEIGGACGASYFQLNHLLAGSVKSWHVVETPAMAAVGGAFFKMIGFIFMTI